MLPPPQKKNLFQYLLTVFMHLSCFIPPPHFVLFYPFTFFIHPFSPFYLHPFNPAPLQITSADVLWGGGGVLQLVDYSFISFTVVLMG
jgi:hypothetical protein